MREKKKHRILGLLVSLVLLTGLGYIPVQAETEVVPSKEGYEVYMKDAEHVFIGNEQAIKYEVGRKYFLNYTVSSIESNTTTQSGMIITTDQTEQFPYTKGGLQYDTKSVLLEEGYTYFLRLEITENGMECIAARAEVNGGNSNYIKLPHTYADITTQGQYFGVWFAENGSITGKLTHVHCYDEFGNDLGVYGNTAEGVIALKNGEMEPNEEVEHYYSFSLQEAGCIAISNLRYTDADEVYLEYQVDNVEKKDITQSGVILTSSPTDVYPHGDGNGQLIYSPHETTEECELLESGATYLYRFIKGTDGYEVLIKRTINGSTDYFSFPHEYGTFREENGYYAVWIGENCSVTADFTNVKCYDSLGNNLAIQTNQGVEITHYGDLEDYSECEAVYYCEANDTFITLDDACNASLIVDGEQNTVQGTYSIRETVLSLTINDNTETYDYVYSALTDKDGNRYIRLKDAKVTFMSSAVGGKKLDTVTITEEDGYKVTVPETPTKEGREFQGWKTADWTEYDFNSVVTKSMTLYASWDGDDYTETGVPEAAADMAPIIAGIISIILVVGAVAAIVIIRVKGGKRSGKKQKNK